MVGGFEDNPLPVDPQARERFAIDDLPLDMRVVDQSVATVAAQLPVLRDLVPVEHRGGLFTMTADGRFLAGPVPEVRGFWLATGCNGTGFSLSPAIGQMLGEWIIGGAPSIDISSLAPARFAGLQLDDARLTARGIWQYTHYYTLDAEPAWE
jgi:4-methylaminobutanoate oxidase (formaldehyde-forming)